MYTTILAWPIAQSATKISILHLYLRLFPTKAVRTAAYGLMAITSMWGFEDILTSVLICQPISFNWDTSVRGGHCADVRTFFLVSGGINTL